MPEEELVQDGALIEFENGEELLFGYAELECTEAKAKIEKGGDLRDKTIVWTIDYTPWQNPGEETGITSDTPFELSDRIDDAVHGYVAGSIRIDGVPVADYVSRDDIPEDADAYALIEASDSGTVLHIGGKMLCAGEAPAGKPAKPIRIMYETTLRDELLLPGTGGDKKVINSAELLAEKGDIFHNLGISGKYEVAVKPPKWIEKTGKTTRYPDGTGSATDWTVTFHPNGFTFTDDNELTLHDQLPAGSTLVPGTVRKNGVSVPVKETENNGFTVLAGEAKEQPVVITYQTTVPEEMYDSGTSLGDNIAWFTFRYQEKDYETSEAVTPVGSGDGSGTSGTVDSSFRTEPEIPGARLTASGQELTFELGDVNTKTLVMFDTKVDPEKAGFNSDGDVKIENTARMKGKADGVIFMEVSHRVEQKFVNHGLLKSSKTDNKNEWIEYEVLINPFGLSLPQTPALVDTLDKRLQIDEDTLRFYKANLSGNSGSLGQKPVYTKIGNGEPLKIDDCDPAANSFTVYLPISAGSRGGRSFPRA